VWKLSDGGDGHTIGSFAMYPDEAMIMSGSPQSRVRLWNTKHDSMVGDLCEGHDSRVRCVA